MNPTPSTPSGVPPHNPFAGLSVQASGAEPLPPGIYIATFVGVEVFNNDKVSDKLKWTWEVVAGQHKGRPATAMTDKRLTPFTHAGRLTAGLIERTLVPGEDATALWTALQPAIGQRWAVTVAPGPKGGKPSVQAVSRPPEM